MGYLHSRPVLLCLDRAAARLIRLGVTANGITVLSAVVAAVAGVLLGLGSFGWAALAMTIACLGDALDGVVARRSGSASIGGALLDASVDRYGEFFFLAGLAVYFHANVPLLLLALFALAGSYMVSYGSAKAEAQRVPVPPGAMRRAERAVCLCAGVALAMPFAWLARLAWVPSWCAQAPVVVSVAVIALAANVSAVRRLRALALSDRSRAAGASRSATSWASCWGRWTGESSGARREPETCSGSRAATPRSDRRPPLRRARRRPRRDGQARRAAQSRGEAPPESRSARRSSSPQGSTPRRSRTERPLPRPT